jgi:hypothetical protein
MLISRRIHGCGGRATVYGARVDGRGHRLESILSLLLEIIVRIRGFRLCDELDGRLRSVITAHCLIAVIKPASMYRHMVSAT